MFAGGKRDEELILPINGSISATLDSSQVERLAFLFLSMKKTSSKEEMHMDFLEAELTY